ncbi:thioredoxin [Phyllobacterium sp. YR620]|uniref:thioredoxin n=1 Tax=Phyllobacterium sp. YR620 TaxID=1881066 RepID=UPI000888C99E|nr:thioredoxin [Phyllobacterium sp. YR620]SDP89155.1 thioredoxin [Phyllobacterium sp. YR620]
MSELIINASDATFETDVMESDIPVLVDFWAPWCGPCRAIAPLLDDLATEYAGRIKIVKINIDDQPATTDRFGVRSIPTLLLVKNGEIAHRDNAMTRTRLRVLFDDILEDSL